MPCPGKGGSCRGWWGGGQPRLPPPPMIGLTPCCRGFSAKIRLFWVIIRGVGWARPLQPSSGGSQPGAPPVPRLVARSPLLEGQGLGGFSFPPRGHCVGCLGRGTSRLPPSRDAFELECCAPSGKGAKRGGLGSLLGLFCTQTQQAVLEQWLFRRCFTLGMIFWGCKTIAFCWVWSKFRLQSTSRRLAMRSCVRTAGSR